MTLRHDLNGAGLDDGDARRMASEVFDRPVLLEAGAGTGKTTALVERLLAWTLGRGWTESADRLAERGERDLSAVAAVTLDGVVAITFTDAAAAEMASRLSAALGTVARGEPGGLSRELAARLTTGPTAALRAQALLASLGRARIQTIHAFCRAILAAHPFESRLHPAFEVDPEGDSLERIATEVLSGQMTAALRAGDANWFDLLGREHEPDEVLSAVTEAVKRDVSADDLEVDPFPELEVASRIADAGASLRPLARALDPVVDRLPANQTRPRMLAAGVRDVLGALGAAPGPETLRRAGEAATELLAEARDLFRDWERGEGLATIGKHLDGDELRRLAAPALLALESLSGLDPDSLARSRRVIAPLVRATRERMRREGWALYEDLLGRASDLLERRPDVRRAVRRSIRQLLVDEFQDTDRRQSALVQALALDGELGERPGLFVVGDPKQSIYGWRRADLASYDGFFAAVRQAPVADGRLSVNFRSAPAILDEVERVLAPAFLPEIGLQPPFERLLPSGRGLDAAARRSGRPSVEYWISIESRSGRKTGLGAANRVEARAIATDLLAERQADPTLAWSDIALLARASGDLEIYLEALRDADVPFAVERDRSFWRRREVIDAAAAVRTAIDPGDRLALVTFLRSPIVGVPDAALRPLWRERLPERLDVLSGPDPGALDAIRELLARAAAATPRDVPRIEHLAGWEASAFAAIEAIAELRAAFGREPAQRFVERLRSRLALETSAAARHPGRFGLANVGRFLRDLEAGLEASGDDPAAVLRLLRRAVAESRQAEEARPPATDQDAVQVMTVHRAKGLQFRHVYLLQVHKGRGAERQRPAFDAERLANGRLGYCLLGHPNLEWSNVRERRRRVAERELVRVLYVAMTRAAERLVVVGQLCGSKRGEGSFRTLFERRFLESPAAPLAAEAGIASLPAFDEHGVLWRAPALEPAWAAEPAERRAESVPSSEALEASQRDVRRLAELRAEATVRALRARFATASSDTLAAPELSSESQLPSGQDQRDRQWARATGVALHRALETAAGGDPGWPAAARATFRAIEPDAPADRHHQLDRALARLAGSKLLRRLHALAPQVLARELPLLVASGSDGAHEPLDGYVGQLDLLYRDPDRGELVVADFKSDELTGDLAIAAAVRRYRPQLELYGRAVRTGLGLADPPRLELWLLDADEIVVLPPAAVE